MTDETNDLPDGETDNVEISENDDLENLDFYDPDEEQDDEVNQAEDGTDDEEGEGEEAAEDADDEPEAEDAPSASEIADDVLVKMPDGSTIPFGDLKESPMLKADHTRKSQALANDRAQVVEKAQNVEGITDALVDFLAKAMPAEPHVGLSVTDPNRYTREKAQYEAAIQTLNGVVEMGRKAKAVTSGMSDEDKRKDQQAHNAQLAQMFPEVSDPAKRDKFLADATEAARAIGYSDEEVVGVYDSKTIALAHWAKKGMDAEKARKTAKAKAAKAPPVSPKKPLGGRKGAGNAEAMRRLGRSGSIEDALAVDFD